MNVLSVARDALSSGSLCDSCLGRLVADRSFGLSNPERGRSLRVTLALEDNEDFDPDGDCWVCEGECDRFDWWATQARTALRGYEFDTYQVGTRVPPLLEENNRLLRADAGLDPEAGELMKREFNREVGKRLGEATGATVDFERPDVVALCDLATDQVEVQINSAFVYGRYRKLKRHIPQTEWPCRDCNGTGLVQGHPCEGCDGTGYRYDESVEQLTAPVVCEAMDGESATFHGAGREDVDARMIGTGRPFVVEVEKPRVRSVDVEQLETDVNEFADGKVEVVGLRLATHEMVERVKQHPASKTYRMDVRFDAPVRAEAFGRALATLDGATVEQDTPQRVSHRRASKTRVRRVYEASGELNTVEGKTGGDSDSDAGEDNNHDGQMATRATVEVHGEGGLYVKELISSDDSRTEPSLAGELGVGATVTALDVLAVDGETEPFEDPDLFL